MGRYSRTWPCSATHKSRQPEGEGICNHGDMQIMVPMNFNTAPPPSAPPTCRVSSPQFCLLRMLFSTTSPTASASAAALSRDRWCLRDLEGREGRGEGRREGREEGGRKDGYLWSSGMTATCRPDTV